MTEEERQYKIIELENYDVLVSFICHKCGQCCYNYVPQFRADDLQKIAQYLNRSEEEIKVRCEECYEKKFNNELDKCLFLNEENQCSIYPLRPEPCRLYPLDTDSGKADVNCPGYEEFYRIFDAFSSRRKLFAKVLDPEEYDRDEIRRVPNREWPSLWRKFISAKPSEHMVLEFIKMNEVPEVLLKEQ